MPFVKLCERPCISQTVICVRPNREEVSGLRVKQLHRHNVAAEAWRDGRREQRGLQVYGLPSDR